MILITGATGNIGGATLDALAGAGHRVRALSRSERTWPEGVEGVTGDLDDAESLVRAAPRGNNMNWVLGHVVATRCDVLSALGQESPWDDSRTQLYRRGMTFSDSPRHLPFEEVIRGFRATQERQ